MFILRVVLFPFALLFDLVTRIRNQLYNLGLKPSVSFDVPIVVVGNLAVGGTGKTPMVEHLVRIFNDRRIKVATLSRGYGRKTKGIRIANSLDDATTIGDEPFQLYTKFGDSTVIAVGEERALAVPYVIDLFPDTQLIIMDDAFQHRSVKPSLNILLTDYYRPFYKDYLMPAGRLRESKIGARRADVVVVTKCPSELTDDEMIDIERLIRRFADKPVFFSRIHYRNIFPFGDHTRELQEKVILVTAIANAKPIREHIVGNFTLVHHFNFPDHHYYTAADLHKIKSMTDSTISIITTEKDMVKLTSEALKPLVSGLPFFYLPIEMEFIKNGEDFEALVQTVLP